MPKINIKKKGTTVMIVITSTANDDRKMYVGSVPPPSPVEGTFWMNTITQILYVFDGITWILYDDNDNLPDHIADYNRAMGVV